ncbi:MAG: FeoB-associated Cys-rich membrane protein [Faecalicoccus sp.]|nr:FeoB-associated Cys-rich membrane protein [Faecalicoccus sp.]
MNAADVLIICLLTIILVRALIVIFNDRKKRKGCLGCSSKCSGCTLSCKLKEHQS